MISNKAWKDTVMNMSFLNRKLTIQIKHRAPFFHFIKFKSAGK